MGSVRKYLAQVELPNRESHHSRLFIDLAENIHIHHREYRTVFSLDEYFEYVDVVLKSTEDVRNFLAQNPNYEENKYPTTLMIAGGKERQLKFLKNSPQPNQSAYFANEFAIELQDEFVTDEIHVHYRDFRVAMDRSRFRLMAEGFKNALRELDEFEANEEYNRVSHSDRMISSFNEENKDDIDTKQLGVDKVDLDLIRSNWYEDLKKDWQPDSDTIQNLISSYKMNNRFPPIILSQELDGNHLIVDGHHRVYAAIEMGLNSIDSVIIGLKFEETAHVREAEVALKKFDKLTDYKFDMSGYMKSYIGYKLNCYYADAFRSKMRKQKLWYRVLRKVKIKILGKGSVFKTFNEAHNR